MNETIVKLLNIETPSLDERLELLDSLYWANWADLDKNYSEELEKVFNYLRSNDLTIEEMSMVLPLYNNIEGAHIGEFAIIIANFYRDNRIKFLKALNLNIDQAAHLVYIFRAMGIFEDGDKEFEEVKSTNKLNEEELETAYTFYRMYKNICNT